MGSTKPESSASSTLALVTCAVVGTLALSVPGTALLMHYFSSNSEPGNATMQMDTTSLDGNMEALRNDKINKNLRQRQNHDVTKSAAHLIGINPNNINSQQRLGWGYEHTVNFPLFDDASRSLSLMIPRSGFYYVYYQVGFRGSHCKKDRSWLTLHSQVFQKHESYSGVPVLLLEGMETVCVQGNNSEKWYTSVSQGRLVHLHQHHCLFVEVSHPELVDYNDGKTFFGVMMVS